MGCSHMSKNKIKVEIYEGDPFTGCCGPGIASVSAVERLRKMLMERNETVRALREEFKEQIEIERQIISGRRKYDMYPPHVCKHLMVGTRVPFVLINGQVVSEGAFPSLDEFRLLIRKYLDSPHQEISGQ